MKMGIRETKRMIKTGIKAYLTKDEKGDYIISELNRLPFFMVGLPGIGKTAIVQQIAEELNIGYVSFSLTHHTRSTLLGLPVIKDLENGGKYTEFSMSEIIAAVYKKCEQGYDEGILMLDEFNCVSDTVLPTMLAFLQTKNIGEYKLPEGWCIVLAGNPTNSNRSAKKLDAALTDRVRKINIEFLADDFIDYAKDNNFYPLLLDYLSTNRGNIYVSSSEEADPVTTRGWENLSETLFAYEKLSETIDLGLVCQFIKQDVIAMDFLNYYAMVKIGCNHKDIEKIMRGTDIEKYGDCWKKLKPGDICSIIDYMGRIICDKAKNKRSIEQVDKGVTNIFRLIECLEKPMLEEKLLGIINHDSELTKQLINTGNKSYIAACKKYCKVA